MPIDIPLLTRICEAPGAPGFEKEIRNLVLTELKGLADDVRVDNMGNVIALKKGKSKAKKSMAAAHMDEIGFIVTYIDDKGFVRFNPVGGFDPKTLTSQRVILHGRKDIMGVMGSKPVHIMSPEEKNKAVKISDYFIDTGLPKKDVDKFIAVGDFVTRHSPLIELREREIPRQPRLRFCPHRDPPRTEKIQAQARLRLLRRFHRSRRSRPAWRTSLRTPNSTRFWLRP